MTFELGDIMRWFYGKITGRPMNFSFIDENVAGSAGPLQKKEVDWMRNVKGIGAILSVREDPLVSDWIDGLQYLDIPVKNHIPPTLAQLEECVDFILKEIEASKKTAVHCAAGKGRTGTVLAAYLCRKKGMNADEAIREIREMRPGSIEEGQEQVIRDYARDLKQTGQRKIF
jgi:atypical dual specificity phosphatase